MSELDLYYYSTVWWESERSILHNINTVCLSGMSIAILDKSHFVSRVLHHIAEFSSTTDWKSLSDDGFQNFPHN